MQQFNNDHNAGTGTCPNGEEAVCTVGSTTAKCGENMTTLVSNTCTTGNTGRAHYNVQLTTWTLPASGTMADMDIASQDGNDYRSVIEAEPNAKDEINDIEAVRTAELTNNTVAQELAAVKANDDDAFVEPTAPPNQNFALANGEANEDNLDEWGNPPPTIAPTQAPTQSPTLYPTPSPTPMCNIPNQCANAPHACNSVCVNTGGGAAFACQCPSGWSLHGALPCSPTPMPMRRLVDAMSAVPPVSLPTSAPTPSPTTYCPCGRPRCLPDTPSPTPSPTPYPTPYPTPDPCAAQSGFPAGYVCTQPPHPQPNSVCTSTGGGGFTCTCPAGYVYTAPVPCTGPWSGTVPAPSPATAPPLGGHSMMHARRLFGSAIRRRGAPFTFTFPPLPSPTPSPPTPNPTVAPTNAPTNAPYCGQPTCQPAPIPN